VNLPNLISLMRLLAAPVAVWLIIDDHMAGAFWLFVAAGVSDAVDGFLAKRLNAQTPFGKYLDPLADKALLMCVFVSLGITSAIDSWLVILVVARDAMIIGGAVLFMTIADGLDTSPHPISKLNTFAQIALASLVLGGAGLGIAVEPAVTAMIYVVAATALLSGGLYLVRLLRQASQVGVR